MSTFDFTISMSRVKSNNFSKLEYILDIVIVMVSYVTHGLYTGLLTKIGKHMTQGAD